MIDLKTNEYYMQQAFKEARKAFELGEVPVGAVVVCNDKIIARAHNQTEQLNDATAHAEMIAMTAASHYLGSKYLSDCQLFVTLEPCVMCAGAMHWSQLKKLVFGGYDKQRGYSLVSTPLLHQKTEIVGGIGQEESARLLHLFFNQIRNKKEHGSYDKTMLSRLYIERALHYSILLSPIPKAVDLVVIIFPTLYLLVSNPIDGLTALK